jgi:hypothetical protein
MARLTKAEQTLVEEFGFEFAPIPERSNTRKGKYHDTFVAARTLCEKNPGQALRVLTADNPSQLYSMAKSINNGERSEFKADSAEWTAQAAKVTDEESGEEFYGLWLTYNGKSE